MAASVIERVLSRLDGVRPSGDGYSARCPAHDDNQNSLSIHEGEDGRALLHCHAGCTVDAIVQALGLTTRDLFPSSPGHAAVQVSITLHDLAEDKLIPLKFLESLGLTNRGDGVVIPYREADGTLTRRNRLRTTLKAKQGSIWLFGKGKPIPYGVDRLKEGREAGFLILVEGESDCWTLWHHGYPALGIPGADMTSKLQAQHLDGIPVVYVVQEPGQGGEVFVRGVARRLKRFGWKGRAQVVTCGDFKDPNDLHKSGAERFRAAFQELLDKSEPLTLPETQSSQADSGVFDLTSLLQECGIAALASEPAAEAVETALRRLTTELVGADRLRRMTVRNVAIDRLKGLDVRSAAKLVDAAFSKLVDDDHDGQEQHLLLSDPTPCSDEVNGAELLTRLVDTFERHLALVQGAAVATALWVLHCYTIDASFVSPILAVISPEKRCGKTTLLTILCALVPRRLPASNITPAALFRTIEAHAPTLLIDEADSFLRSNDELRGVLNSGHTRSTANVIRTTGDNHEPRTFSTWCPKAIALIGKLPGTLEDRSIVIPMRRRAPGEAVERLRADRIDSELAELRSQAARWAEDCREHLRGHEPEVPDEFHDRSRDNWRPLLSIADVISGEWPRQAREAARQLELSEEETTPRVQLLADIREIFIKEEADRLESKTLVEKLQSMEDRPWPEWGRQAKPISTTQVARLLRPLDIRPRSIRIGSTTAKGYQLADFDDSFSRYLPPPEPSHRNNVDISSKSDDPKPSQPDPCYALENPKSPEQRDCYGVTGRNGGPGGEDNPSRSNGEDDGSQRELFDL